MEHISLFSTLLNLSRLKKKKRCSQVEKKLWWWNHVGYSYGAVNCLCIIWELGACFVTVLCHYHVGRRICLSVMADWRSKTRTNPDTRLCMDLQRTKKGQKKMEVMLAEGNTKNIGRKLQSDRCGQLMSSSQRIWLQYTRTLGPNLCFNFF